MRIKAVYSYRSKVYNQPAFFFFFSILVVVIFDSVLIVCLFISPSSSHYWGGRVQIYKNYAIPSFAYVGSAFSYVDY